MILKSRHEPGKHKHPRTQGFDSGESIGLKLLQSRHFLDLQSGFWGIGFGIQGFGIRQVPSGQNQCAYLVPLGFRSPDSTLHAANWILLATLWCCHKAPPSVTKPNYLKSLNNSQPQSPTRKQHFILQKASRRSQENSALRQTPVHSSSALQGCNEGMWEP